MRINYILPTLCLLGLGACQTPQQQAAATGPSPADYFANTETGVQDGNIRLIPIQTPRGQFKVWTKRFGNNPRIKVLLLHGGPACTHEYFECFENFLPAEGIEFIYYDQLGSAYSDQPDDSTLWQLPRFVEELEQVRQALGLNKDNCYLLGHSWGGILAMEYAMKYQDNIKGLIISNMMSSCPAYGRYADEVLAKQFDPSVLDTIRQIEARGDFDNPKYMELLTPHFYTQHILRMPAEEWPDPVNRTFAHLNEKVYVTMQGPSEFGIGGNLAQWDRSADLHNIKIPTLVIGATHDTMDPKHMEWMAGQIPKGRFLLCPNGSHMDMWDDQQVYFQGLIKFLKETDAGR
ncbi:MAG TPA: proline iminopeptidase-family hydrolase [Saprospiraceae bacterium]|nr:proline iminopeptidase-family hydrolase [Saprospiraceae bacterium]